MFHRAKKTQLLKKNGGSPTALDECTAVGEGESPRSVMRISRGTSAEVGM